MVLESEDSTNPNKILGIVWEKRDDTLEVQVPEPPDNQPLTKRGILSQLASIYDPLGMISPTTVKGKQIYRDTCDETKQDSWIVWEKRDDTLEVQVPEPPDNQPLTKRGILSQLASIYDPLGMISPTTVKGKQIYRDACDKTKGWNADVSDQLKREWIKWSSQLKTVGVPGYKLYIFTFADASSIACSAVTIAVVEGTTGVLKGLLTSKSRISKRNTSIAS